MSVLVEAVCIIVPKQVLERKYPGGTEAFLTHLASRRSGEHRYVCCDHDLVCLSYFNADAADRGLRPLVQAGMREIIDEEFIDFAIVDQRHGPILQCTWLSWTHNPAGYTSAWLTGQLPGGLFAPEGWSIANAMRAARIDIRTIPGSALKLSDEDGVETWLDFTTGHITTRTRNVES